MWSIWIIWDHFGLGGSEEPEVLGLKSSTFCSLAVHLAAAWPLWHGVGILLSMAESLQNLLDYAQAGAFQTNISCQQWPFCIIFFWYHRKTSPAYTLVVFPTITPSFLYLNHFDSTSDFAPSFRGQCAPMSFSCVGCRHFLSLAAL